MSKGFGSGLMAAGEILAYNIFDPINLLGFGAGKAIASYSRSCCS
jgi:hypothetical protein